MKKEFVNKLFARKMEKILQEIQFVKDNSSSYESLSIRELQIAGLLIEGKTIGQISHTLNRSTNTINNQKQSLKKKINAKTDADIVRFASAFEIIFESDANSLK